ILEDTCKLINIDPNVFDIYGTRVTIFGKNIDIICIPSIETKYFHSNQNRVIKKSRLCELKILSINTIEYELIDNEILKIIMFLRDKKIFNNLYKITNMQMITSDFIQYRIKQAYFY